jgi:predicted TIM-barrel enzyme
MIIPRNHILERLREQLARGRPVVGTGAGIGLSAKSAEAGGADLIVVYNSGRFRMAGRGSAAGLMPYGDANQIVVEMAAEILPVVERTPVLAGVCGTDPFRDMREFVPQLARLGFSGVQNFPTVGLLEGATRQTLEETGMGFGLEVDMIRVASELGLLTMPYVFDAEQAAAMAAAGADIVVAHLGTTVRGATGARTAPSLEECACRIAAMRDAARAVKPEVIVLCHGGPIAEPADAQEIFRRVPGVDGFLGASSTERLPVERAIADAVNQFKSISIASEAHAAN